MELFTGNTSSVQQAYQITSSHYDNLEAHDTEVFRDGFDHTVIVVDGTTAFRFAKNQEYLDKLAVVSGFLKEFAPSSPVSVPTSEIFYYNDTPYEKYSFLPGKPLKADLAANFPPEKLALIAGKIGSFLSALHSFSPTRAEELGIPRHDPHSDWSNRYESIKRYVSPLMNETENAWIDSLFGDFLPLLEKNDTSFPVTHFDVKPDHIIVNPESHTLEGIIDFGDMRIGDPAYDFSFRAQYSIDLTPHALETYDQERDETFMRRIEFYQNILPVMDLDHVLEIGSHEKVDSLKSRLSHHITDSHLL